MLLLLLLSVISHMLVCFVLSTSFGLGRCLGLDILLVFQAFGIHISRGAIDYAWLRNSAIGWIHWLIKLAQDVHRILHVLYIILVGILQVRNILAREFTMWLVRLAHWSNWMRLVHILSMCSIDHIVHDWAICAFMLILLIIIFCHHIFIICITMIIATILTGIGIDGLRIFRRSQSWPTVVKACHIGHIYAYLA